jgi:hypothetical protein
MHSPLLSFSQRRVGQRHVIPLERGRFSWCLFELLAGILFRVRSRIPFAENPT